MDSANAGTVVFSKDGTSKNLVRRHVKRDGGETNRALDPQNYLGDMVCPGTKHQKWIVGAGRVMSRKG